MVFSPEMDNAIKQGYKFEILWGYKFEAKFVFKDYVECLYKLRSKLGIKSQCLFKVVRFYIGLGTSIQNK
jgi:hypothetical protein